MNGSLLKHIQLCTDCLKRDIWLSFPEAVMTFLYVSQSLLLTSSLLLLMNPNRLNYSLSQSQCSGPNNPAYNKWGLAENWLTQHNINFYFATQLLFLARRYKFDYINNNELLTINLAAVRADGNANISSSPSRERCAQPKPSQCDRS